MPKGQRALQVQLTVLHLRRAHRERQSCGEASRYRTRYEGIAYTLYVPNNSEDEIFVMGSSTANVTASITAVLTSAADVSTSRHRLWELTLPRSGSKIEGFWSGKCMWQSMELIHAVFLRFSRRATLVVCAIFVRQDTTRGHTLWGRTLV